MHTLTKKVPEGIPLGPYSKKKQRTLIEKVPEGIPSPKGCLSKGPKDSPKESLGPSGRIGTRKKQHTLTKKCVLPQRDALGTRKKQRTSVKKLKTQNSKKSDKRKKEVDYEPWQIWEH